ncbi:MAG: SDR family NAD(P)-dependent oxidoreductase [Pseudomonadota bacterium]
MSGDASGPRTALITGAGQNIGRAIALRLAKDGFNIAINGRRKREQCDAVADEIRAAGGVAHVFMADIGKDGEADALAKSTLDRFGRVDVLVTNAAIRPASPTLEMDLAEWREVLAVNFEASFLLARATLPGMVEAGWGRIINFAGMNAIQGYNGRAHVSASKHAVWGLTKALAKEFGAKGITANVISPGPIRSDHDDPEMTAHINAQVTKIPMGRLGVPDEVAAAASLLASDDGGFINGQLIQVNGGTQT